MGMHAACLLLEFIGGSSLVESCSRGKREQAEKVVAVEASRREGRLRHFADIIAIYISHILSVNKDTCERISSVLRLFGLRITSRSRYYTIVI